MNTQIDVSNISHTSKYFDTKNHYNYSKRSQNSKVEEIELKTFNKLSRSENIYT